MWGLGLASSFAVRPCKPVDTTASHDMSTMYVLQGRVSVCVACLQRSRGSRTCTHTKELGACGTCQVGPNMWLFATLGGITSQHECITYLQLQCTDSACALSYSQSNLGSHLPPAAMPANVWVSVVVAAHGFCLREPMLQAQAMPHPQGNPAPHPPATACCCNLLLLLICCRLQAQTSSMCSGQVLLKSWVA